MKVGVVGVPTVTGPTGSITGAGLGGRRARSLLVALALEGGPLTGTRLADLVWDGSPPTTWPVALRGLVRGLRTVGSQAGLAEQSLVATVPGGYCLGGDVEVDVHEAEASVTRGRALLSQGRHRAAGEAVAEATRLRGADVLAGHDSAWLAPHRARVDDLARQAWEVTAEAAAAAGDHAAAVSAGRRLVAVTPLDERSHRLLIAALDRAGDRAGAVRAFETCRAVLAEELGVDPAPETVQTYLDALGERSPARSASAPVSASSFRGRREERARLTSALAGAGLVTLTGPGGVGKSRVAAEVVRSMARPEGGSSWVELESVGEDTLVVPTVLLTLGHPVGDDPVGTLVAALSPLGRSLLVLDGVEAVLDGVGSMVHELLRRCPALTVLVTSRVPLGLQDERVLAVAPWELPDEDDVTTDDPLVGLLLDRVAERGGALTDVQATGALVHGLLRRCAGLPLAVELVAAQLAASSPGDLADQLDELLAHADDPVRGVASSSYALLSVEEAAVFRRFGVLEGGVPLALVREVVAGDDLPRARVLRLLGQVASYGLLRADRSTERWRWAQDDELHRYARELLAAEGAEEATFARLAAAVRAMLPDDPRTPPGGYAESVTDVLASVRSLFGAGVAGSADAAGCLELAYRLHRYWAATSVGEGRYWLERLLRAAREREVGSDWVAYATYALGYLEYWSGDSDLAVPRLREAADLMAGIDDEYVARALIFLAGLLDDVDQGAEAVTTIREAVAIADRFGPALQMPAVMGIGSVLSERGDPEAAEHAVRAVALARAAAAPEQLTVGLPAAAMICWMVGAHDLARAYVAEAMPLHAAEARISRVVLYSAAAGLALADGDIVTAVDLARTADLDATELGVERELPLVRALRARALLARGDLGHAAESAASALDAALALAYDFPLALGLETAVVVLAAARAGTPDEHAELLASAAGVRRRGDRPAPASLRLPPPPAPTPSSPTESTESTESTEPRAAARIALKLLESLPGRTSD